jgi:curved DNA-binding protein
MEFKDYYKIMGLSHDATQDEIKRTYRRLARKYHPDVSKEPNAEERFKEVGEAYEVLKDPEKRAAYDRLLKGEYRPGEEFRPPPGWDSGFEFSGGGFTGADTSQFSDFFESLFGAGSPFGARSYRRGGYARRGEDHHARIQISLEDAYRGATRTLTLEVPAVDNQGHVVTRSHTLNVKIPAGVSEGQQIRLAGQGAPGVGDAPAGDLYLEVLLAPHPLYRAEGRDIYLTFPIAPWEAALGAKVTVPTLGGKVDMKIPAGAQSGQKLRLKGRGLPGRSPGDQYLVLQIRTPKPSTESQKQLYKQLAEAIPFNPRAHMGV